MIGMYIWSLDKSRTPNKNILENQEKFVPFNSLTEVIELDNNPKGYMIMPTTYAKGKIGPFILSVSTEVDFVLTVAED